MIDINEDNEQQILDLGYLYYIDRQQKIKKEKIKYIYNDYNYVMFEAKSMHVSYVYKTKEDAERALAHSMKKMFDLYDMEPIEGAETVNYLIDKYPEEFIWKRLQ